MSDDQADQEFINQADSTPEYPTVQESEQTREIERQAREKRERSRAFAIERTHVGPSETFEEARIRIALNSIQLYREMADELEDGLNATFPGAMEALHPWNEPLDLVALFENPPEREWLVEGFFPRGYSIAVHAPHKTGKSLLSLWIAGCIAIGRDPFTGATIKRVRVHYFDSEMTPTDILERLMDMGFDPHQLKGWLIYHQHSRIRDLDTPEGGAILMQCLRHYESEVAIFDTIVRFVRGDENSNDTYKNFDRFSGAAMKAAGISSYRLDHEGHNGTHARGASAKGDDVDIDWRLERKDGGFTLKCILTRVGDVREEFSIAQSIDPLSFTTGPRLYLAGTREKAKELESLGIPVDTTRRKVQQVYKELGLKAGDSKLLDAAIKYRKDDFASLLLPQSVNGTGSSTDSAQPFSAGPST